MTNHSTVVPARPIMRTRTDWPALALVVILYYPVFNGMLMSIWERFSLPGASLVDLLLLVGEAFVIAAGMIHCLRLDIRTVVLTFCGLLAALGLTVVLFPQNLPYLTPFLKDMFVFCAPAFIVMRIHPDATALLHTLERWAYVPLISCIIYIVCSPLERYSMWLSYAMLIPLAFILHKLFVRFRLVDFLLFTVVFILILVYGSRGAIVSLATAFIWLVWRKVLEISAAFDAKRRDRMRRLLLVLLIVGASLVAIFFIGVHSGLWLTLFPTQNRTLLLLLSGQITNSAGRTSLAYPMMLSIMQAYLWGSGLFGDLAMAEQAGLGGMAAHNMLLEVWVDMGVLLGSVFLVAIARWIVRFWRSSKSREEDALLLIFAACSLLPLMVSASFLTYTPFAVLMGLCQNTRDKKVYHEL